MAEVKNDRFSYVCQQQGKALRERQRLIILHQRVLQQFREEYLL